jgi:hypothetical protein
MPFLPDIGERFVSSTASGEGRKHREHVPRGQDLLRRGVTAIDDRDTREIARDLQRRHEVTYGGAGGNLEGHRVTLGSRRKVSLEESEESDLDLHPTFGAD